MKPMHVGMYFVEGMFVIPISELLLIFLPSHLKLLYYK